jgi:hypothetical protein
VWADGEHGSWTFGSEADARHRADGARIIGPFVPVAEVEGLRAAAFGVSTAGGVYCKLCNSPAWNRAADVIHDADCPMPSPQRS